MKDQGRWSISLAHPGYVSRMKQTPDKTDYSDARMLADLTRMLADLTRVGYLPRVWIAPQGTNRWTLKWIDWLATAAPLSAAGRWIIDEHLDQLRQIKERIAQVETLLQEMTKDDPVVQRLIAMKAIGLITACALRAEIGQFDRFNNGKQLSRFRGLTPRNASSGQRQADAGLITSRGKLPRATRIEAARRLIRFDERWSQLAARPRQNGKPICATIAAAANRLIRWLRREMTAPQPQAA